MDGLERVNFSGEGEVGLGSACVISVSDRESTDVFFKEEELSAIFNVAGGLKTLAIGAVDGDGFG